MNDDRLLITRARMAAGISWSGDGGGHGNRSESQEPEVRSILRKCADRMLICHPNDGFVDTTCESCGCRVLVERDDSVHAVFCPPCGGGIRCAAYGRAIEMRPE